jgi:hypothetical protein
MFEPAIAALQKSIPLSGDSPDEAASNLERAMIALQLPAGCSGELGKILMRLI